MRFGNVVVLDGDGQELARGGDARFSTRPAGYVEMDGRDGWKSWAPSDVLEGRVWVTLVDPLDCPVGTPVRVEFRDYEHGAFLNFAAIVQGCVDPPHELPVLELLCSGSVEWSGGSLDGPPARWFDGE